MYNRPPCDRNTEVSTCGDVPDVITTVKFDVDWVRGFGSGCSIDKARRPYRADCDSSHSYRERRNSTFRNFVLTGPIITKLGTVDYVGDVNFSYIWLSGEFPANRWNVTSLWLFVVSLFFVRTPSEKTRERICTRNGSERVKSGKDVPFWGFVKKWSPPPPLTPKFRKFCITKAVLRSKHRKHA